MEKNDVVKILKRKAAEYKKAAECALAKHDHNSESSNDYFLGVAAGLMEAVGVVGMLGKPNRVNHRGIPNNGETRTRHENRCTFGKGKL